MIICSREEANKLINEESNLFRTDERNKDILDYETILIKHGRGDNTPNLDNERRKEIATLALTTGLTTEEVADFCGVSRDAVNAYRQGATSEATYHKRDGELGEHVKQVKQEVTVAAQNKLMLAIESITQEKIHLSKARDIAGIAKDMSGIIKDMNGSGDTNIQNSKVIIYQPRMKEEDDYEAIVVGE